MTPIGPLSGHTDREWTDIEPGDWTDPDSIAQAVIDVFAAGLLGEALFGALVGGAVMLGMYIYSDDMALPTVLLILLSSFVLQQLPGAIQGFAVGLLWLGLAAGIFEVGRRYIE